ncbi:MAG: glycoside hydrolase family 9 protein [Dysgonomonas sp.]
MKNRFILLLCFFFSVGLLLNAQAKTWIRVNQLGYLPNSVKVAVSISKDEAADAHFIVRDAKTGASVYEGGGVAANAERWGMKNAFRFNFTELRTEGEYYIENDGVRSPVFRIGSDVYDNTADFLLKYMRQQRCGYNPYLDTLCHQYDGVIVDHPTRSGERVDVRGGWHDASDYLQYLTTSANATFQMLFAWQQTPDKTIFKDEYDALGKKGQNGIPDILDEVRWGLEWMVRMNPDSAVMFNQIADDRDHASMRLPSRETVDYGWGSGKDRPVYFITGKSQGLGKYKNRTTGVSSSAAKFVSAFALGAEIFKGIDPAFANVLQEKVSPAYAFAKSDLGNTQTACLKSPYFYEEDNWVDDMELAAAVNYDLKKNENWLKEADYWGQLEAITPWMEKGTARHYQYYPFVNLGHYYMSMSSDESMRKKYLNYMDEGLACLLQRAQQEDDPFLNGVPFIWCSNNLVAAAVTQARLYHQASGDGKYLEMEASLRDWLFGCNPWGTSMICGLPENGDSPTRPHSAYVELLDDLTYGGLVDGPIYSSIYKSLWGIHLKYDDPYAEFQDGAAVYHDDPGDYSSNEPTMDGTASLSFYLSAMQKMGKNQPDNNDVVDAYGAMVKHDADKKNIYLIFSADERFEGANAILNTLRKHKAKGSFFLTGNCLRNADFSSDIKRIINEGHYLGGHSDNHLLYAAWENRDNTLVTPDSLVSDFRKNMREIERFGIETSSLKYFLSPYEWYNYETVQLIGSQGQQVVNMTPGVRTAADYTTPDMKNYASSQDLIDQLYNFEKEKGLNGAIILIHPGTHPDRTDKLYNRLDEIINHLKKRGYSFERF